MIRQLAKQTIIYGGSHVINKVLNYIFIGLYLTYKFEGEPEGYAMHGDLYFYVALLLVLLTFRMETTYFRFVKKFMPNLIFSNGSLLLLLGSIIWTGLFLAFNQSIAVWLKYPDHPEYIKVLGFVLAVDVLVALPMARFRHENKALTFAVIRFFGVVINVGAILFFLELCPRFEDLALIESWYTEEQKLLYVLYSNLIASLLTLLVVFPQYLKTKWVVKTGVLLQMLTYAWPLVLVGIAGVINQSSFTTWQKLFLNNDTLNNLSIGGGYLAATKIAILMSLFTVAFNYAAEPFFFNQKEDNKAPVIRANVSLAYTLTGCLILLIVGMNPQVFGLLLGTDFREYLYVTPWLMLSFLLLGLYYNISIWYKLFDRTIYGAYISLLGAGITILINVLFLPKIGVNASVIATLLCYLLMNISCIWFGKSFGTLNYPYRKIILYIVLAMLLVLLKSMITIESILLSVLVGLVLLAVFIWIVWNREGELLKEMIRN